MSDVDIEPVEVAMLTQMVLLVQIPRSLAQALDGALTAGSLSNAHEATRENESRRAMKEAASLGEAPARSA